MVEVSLQVKSVNELYTTLYGRVIEDDISSQRYYLDVIATQRQISIDYLLDLGVLFIPNETYIAHYLGGDIVNTNNCFYSRGSCLWTLFAIIPVRNLVGEVKGIVGWDSYNAYKRQTTEEADLLTYKNSSVEVFKRDKFFLSDIECLRKTFDKRVIFVTDGVFDALTLSYRGIPSAGLLGSTFSPEVLYFLSWYTHVYLCMDNDEAGLALLRRLKRALPNVWCVTQNKTKDIEALLRGDGKEGPISQQLHELVDSPRSENICLRA